MPRLSNSSLRSRSILACDGCRRRKEKCDAANPCRRCVKRAVPCHYDQPSARAVPNHQQPSQSRVYAEVIATATGAPRTSKRRKLVQLSEQLDPNEAEDAIDHVLNQPTPRGTTDNVTAPDATVHLLNEPEAPVPRVARLLRDGRGKFIYIGDSASLSFLQNVRRIVSSTLGACDFTTDRLRHSFFEQVPDDAQDAEDVWNGGQRLERGLIPQYDEAENLVNRFLVATACLLDLFDVKELLSGFEEWIRDPESNTQLSGSIFYLVLAIGAQVSTEDEVYTRAELYFSRGRRLAFSNFTEQPSIQTVQSYALITMYLLGACRRNASFMNLGIAVRAAYALGLHGGDIHALFSEAERKSRDRVWQSLRVLDLFLSASLGRPPSTSDFEKDPSAGDTYAKPNLSSADERFATAVLRLCSIFERILNDAYKKQVVSAQLADEVSRQYRAWASKLPKLPTPLHNQPSGEKQSETFRQLASAHLIGAYHWSIILLTRPFLMFQISSFLKKSDKEVDPYARATSGVTTISTFADACIDSAIRGLDIADELMQCPELPRRLPFVLNSVFNSALAIGVAFFGGYEKDFPLRDAMEKAERVLALMRQHDPQAKRFAQVISYLHSAASDYVRRRERTSMQIKSKTKHEIFGTIRSMSRLEGQGLEPSSIDAQDNDQSSATQVDHNFDENESNDVQDANADQSSQSADAPRDQSYTSIQMPTLTTSGFLIGETPNFQVSDRGYNEDIWFPLNEAGESLSQFGVDVASYAETIPMFNLLGEF